MKKEYQAPHAEVVKVRLCGSVLDDVGFNNGGSQGADPNDSFSKKNDFFFDYEERENDNTIYKDMYKYDEELYGDADFINYR